MVAFHPARRLGAVVLSNSRANLYASISELGLYLLDSSYPLTTIRRPFQVSTVQLHNLAGQYRSEEGDRFEIRVERDQLIFYHPASRADFPAMAITATRFEALGIELGPNTTGQFELDSNARAVSLKWTQSGRTHDYAREPDPNQLSLRVAKNELELVLTGDDPSPYRLEISENLDEWRPADLFPTPNSTVRIPFDAKVPVRFFRAARHSP